MKTRSKIIALIIFLLLCVMFCSPTKAQTCVDTTFYPNGTVQELRPYCDSTHQLNGTCIAFAINGDTLAIANYKNGLKDGLWRIWREDGRLAYEMHYSQGKKVGTWKFYDLEGNLVQRKYEEDRF